MAGGKMNIEKPGEMRSRIIDSGSRIEVIMPSKRRKFMGIYILASLVLMYVVIFSIFHPFGGSDGRSFRGPFIIFALFLGWTTISWGLSGLWNLMGEEILSIDTSSLRIARRIGFLALKRKYSRGSCSNFRTNPIEHSRFSNRDIYAFFGFGGGAMAFDFKGKTVKLASGLDEAEVKEILKRLESRGFIKSKPDGA